MSKTEEFMINTAQFSANCIRMGNGEKTLILISGLNVKDVKGKVAASGLAYSYRSFLADYTAYIFDRRENLPEEFSCRQIAEDIAVCMDSLGLGEADVLGVSQGGMIAQYLAIDHPDKVKHLALGVTASRPDKRAVETLEGWCAAAEREGVKAVMRDYFYSAYSDEYIKKYRAFIPMLLKNAKTMELKRFLTLARACITCDTYDELDKIRCPVLVLGGEKDNVLSAQSSREIAEKLNCEIYMYSGYGHSAYEEAPDFNRRVKEFFSR